MTPRGRLLLLTDVMTNQLILGRVGGGGLSWSLRRTQNIFMSKNTCFTYTTLEGKHVLKNDNKKVLSPTLPKKEKNGANIIWLLDYGWLSTSCHCFISIRFRWIISASLNVFYSQLEDKRQYHICPHLSFRRSHWIAVVAVAAKPVLFAAICGRALWVNTLVNHPLVSFMCQNRW